MKAFKVVRAERDKLLSCVAKDFMCVEYKVGEFVRGDLGPLMCFKGFYEALYFVRTLGRGDYRIYYCELEDPDTKPAVRLRIEADLTEEIIRSFWKYELPSDRALLHVPNGTVLAGGVQLIQEVWRGQGDRMEVRS